MEEIKDMATNDLMEEYDDIWVWLTGGQDSCSEEVQKLSKLLNIERELTRRETR